MSVHPVNILNEQGQTILGSVPVHVNELDANCILWGEDCTRLEVAKAYRLSFVDGSVIRCSVTEIQVSTVERSETVNFKLASRH